MNEVDATAEEVSAELEPYEPATAPSNLFHTDDPVDVVEKATRVADALKKVLVDKGMIQPIHGRDHVKVEGWTTLGAMLGVVPVVTWTRKIDRGWEARVEARTLDGRVIGAAEAECLKDEENWKDSEDYAVRSMAQTRATSKALSGPLRFIVTLAGYSSTPAEEMDGVKGTRGAGGKPSEKQLAFLRKIIEGGTQYPTPSRAQLMAVMETVNPGLALKEGWLEGLTKADCSALLDKLTKEPLPQHPLPDTDHPSDIPEPADGEFEHPKVNEPTFT